MSRLSAFSFGFLPHHLTLHLGEGSFWAHCQSNSFTCRTISVTADDNYWYNLQAYLYPSLHNLLLLLYSVRHSPLFTPFPSAAHIPSPYFLSTLSSSSSSLFTGHSLHLLFAPLALASLPFTFFPLFPLLCRLFLPKHWVKVGDYLWVTFYGKVQNVKALPIRSILNASESSWANSRAGKQMVQPPNSPDLKIMAQVWDYLKITETNKSTWELWQILKKKFGTNFLKLCQWN